MDAREPWSLRAQGSSLSERFEGCRVGAAAHAFGVSQAAEDYRWRTLGMTLTFFAIVGGGIANLTGWAS